MSNAVERARELLATITPGPWEFTDDPTPFGWTTRKIVHPNDPYHELNVLKVRMAKSARNECCWPPTRADAEFIAAAPQLVADLLDELDATTNYYNMACTRCESHPDSFTHQDVPRCGAGLDFQTKDLGQTLATYSVDQAMRGRESLTMLGGCEACHWWVDVTIKTGNAPIDIDAVLRSISGGEA